MTSYISFFYDAHWQLQQFGCALERYSSGARLGNAEGEKRHPYTLSIRLREEACQHPSTGDDAAYNHELKCWAVGQKGWTSGATFIEWGMLTSGVVVYPERVGGKIIIEFNPSSFQGAIVSN